MSDYANHALKPNARIALYFAPPAATAWWQAGCEWLGRDAESGALLTGPTVAGIDSKNVTHAPRRYGWHGTVVAPFRCADGVTYETVLAAAQRWAQQQVPFAFTVKASLMGRFVALRAAQADDDATLRAIAASALHALRPLRARSSDAEIERRIVPGMSDRQIALLRAFDYPYVLDEFRFHMTLSGSLEDAGLRDTIARHWTDRMTALGPMPFSEVSLFVEPEPGAPFVLRKRLPLGAGKQPA